MINDKYRSLFNAYNVNTPLRVAHFMAQIEHESGLKPVSENLNYSAKGLSKTFPKYFSTVKLANEYANKPQLIANKVYANRMGNGDEKSGDGWKYRGRGFIQVTGKNNYLVLSKDTRIDFVNNPDLLLEEPNAIISALWYWKKNKLNELADNNNLEAITKAINGGYNGLEDRARLLKKYI